MSYVKSLRFKLMLLCVVPLFSVAVIFIAHSVFIAFQMRDMSDNAYLAAITAAGAEENVIQAARGVSVEMGWIARQWSVFFAVALVCFYIPITINIGKFIKPIREVSQYSDSLAVGDINIEVIKDRTDEIGVLQESFQRLVKASRQQAELIQKMASGDISGNYTPRSDSDVVGHSLVQMLERNNAAMRQVAEAAGQITSSASQIADSSQLLASGATQQSAAVSELSDSIRDVARLTHENTQMVNGAAALGDAIISKAQYGGRQMEQMVEAVKEINDASLAINKVMKVIDDIAFQTNILALNAAVEAARAGQHGKGFAVVADEVRSLASKSAEAAKDTGSLIANSIEKAKHGTQIATETAASLTEIVAEIGESSRIITNIAKSYEQQDGAIGKINISMDQVSQVVHQNSASAEESAAASEEMSAQSKILQELVLQFKLKEALYASEARLHLNSQPQSSRSTAYALNRSVDGADKY